MSKYGTIISFYSFKGGVGRSMALANVAALLCRAGKSVLIVDWDLEAPGLHKFFENFSSELRPRIAETRGVLDLICAVKKGQKIAWREAAIRVPLGSSSLDLISAGRRDAQYSSRLQGLRWDDLYEQRDIGQAFEYMRDEWKASYDYVLLDSRTGVTDIGDVCTALLPDLLVTVFVANEQNIEGTKLIIERARTVHAQFPRDRTKLTVIPLLGRDESFTEYELSASWRNRIAEDLGFTLMDWLPKELNPQSYFQKIFIPYYSYWSFGENLPVIQREEELSNPTSISAAYARLTTLIDADLDWSALEKGVNAAEINSLRSRANESEAKSVELEFAQREIQLMQEDREKKRGRDRRTYTVVGVGSVIGMVGMAALLYGLEARRSDRAARSFAEAQLVSERTKMDESKRQIEEQRTQLTRQVTELQSQNIELLRQLQKQSSETQQKLDEIITEQSKPYVKPYIVTLQDERTDTAKKANVLKTILTLNDSQRQALVALSPSAAYCDDEKAYPDQKYVEPLALTLFDLARSNDGDTSALAKQAIDKLQAISIYSDFIRKGPPECRGQWVLRLELSQAQTLSGILKSNGLPSAELEALDVTTPDNWRTVIKPTATSSGDLYKVAAKIPVDDAKLICLAQVYRLVNVQDGTQDVTDAAEAAAKEFRLLKGLANQSRTVGWYNKIFQRDLLVGAHECGAEAVATH